MATLAALKGHTVLETMALPEACPQPGYVADLFDFYQVVLVENQVLALSVFYADNVDAFLSRPIDLTLRLLDPLNSNAEVASLDITLEGTSSLTASYLTRFYH